MNTDISALVKDIQDRVSEVAYLMWNSAGRHHGMALDYWLAAEREVISTMQAAAERMMPAHAEGEGGAASSAAPVTQASTPVVQAAGAAASAPALPAGDPAPPAAATEPVSQASEAVVKGSDALAASTTAAAAPAKAARKPPSRGKRMPPK